MLYSKKLKIFLSLSLLVSVIGCQTITNPEDNLTGQQVSIQNNSTLTKTALDGWKRHLLDVALDEGKIQKGCDPYYKLAKGKSKGSVMLFHGFSACPQQYDEISKTLSEKGFNVFVPLLPGHGQSPTISGNKITDYSERLPDLNSTAMYDGFAKRMGAMLKDEQGVKVVAGLSVGGAIATKSMIDNPDVYDRGLLMAPFFNASNINSFSIPLLGSVIPNKTISWGDGCEKQRKLGRAGYCDMKLTNIAAARRFGLDTLKQTNSIKKPMQIIGVEKDNAANNSEISQAVKNIKSSRACFFPKGTNHSMFSAQDNIGVNMFWIKALEVQMINYITTGKNFDVVGKSEHDLGLCRYN